MSAVCEEFRAVSRDADPSVWAGALWRVECKTCPWRGPQRRHRFDCGPDAVEHFESRGRNPEVVPPYKEKGLSVV